MGDGLNRVRGKNVLEQERGEMSSDTSEWSGCRVCYHEGMELNFKCGRCGGNEFSIVGKKVRVIQCVPCCSERKLQMFREKKYGLNNDTFQKIGTMQGWRCGVCEGLLDFKFINVDHCHRTGLVRGLLCRHCNLVLGQSRDDPKVLRSAALYLENGGTDAAIKYSSRGD